MQSTAAIAQSSMLDILRARHEANGSNKDLLHYGQLLLIPRSINPNIFLRYPRLLWEPKCTHEGRTAKLVTFSPATLDGEFAVLRCHNDMHGVVAGMDVRSLAQASIKSIMRRRRIVLYHNTVVQLLVRRRFEFEQVMIEVHDALEELVQPLGHLLRRYLVQLPRRPDVPALGRPRALPLRDALRVVDPAVLVRVSVVLPGAHGLPREQLQEEGCEPALGIVRQPARAEGHVLEIVVAQP